MTITAQQLRTASTTQYLAPGLQDLFAQAADRIEELERGIAKGATWIPVSERLPEDWRALSSCLIATGSPVCPVETTTTHPGWWNHKANLPENNGPTVTHWMPLPEPPK